jgi:hypothetical protein
MKNQNYNYTSLKNYPNKFQFLKIFKQVLINYQKKWNF